MTGDPNPYRRGVFQKRAYSRTVHGNSNQMKKSFSGLLRNFIYMYVPLEVILVENAQSLKLVTRSICSPSLVTRVSGHGVSLKLIHISSIGFGRICDHLVNIKPRLHTIKNHLRFT